jgi:hypothetical protein
MFELYVKRLYEGRECVFIAGSRSVPMPKNAFRVHFERDGDWCGWYWPSDAPPAPTPEEAIAAATSNRDTDWRRIWWGNPGVTFPNPNAQYCHVRVRGMRFLVFNSDGQYSAQLAAPGAHLRFADLNGEDDSAVALEFSSTTRREGVYASPTADPDAGAIWNMAWNEYHEGVAALQRAIVEKYVPILRTMYPGSTGTYMTTNTSELGHYTDAVYPDDQ